MLCKNSNPFDCEEEDLEEQWESAINEFVIRGMLGKRRTGDMQMISDAGGDYFIKNADIIKLLNEAGANLNLEKEEERYNIINDVYKKDAAR